MAKVKIIYEFDSYEDAEEMRDLIQHRDVYHVISEFKNWLRNINKYSEKETINVEEVYSKLCNLIYDEEIEL